MSKNKICIACGFEDFEDNINNFCCNCGKDIDTGLTLEEMDKQGINYLIDKRTNEYRKDGILEYNLENTNKISKVILELEDIQNLIGEMNVRTGNANDCLTEVYNYIENKICKINNNCSKNN